MNETLPGDQLPEELKAFAEDYLRDNGHIYPDRISWTRLLGDGSDRVLYRVKGGETSLILVINENSLANALGVNENDSFNYICRHLRDKGIATPEIYRYQREKGWFLLEDLGTVHFYDEAVKLKNNPHKLMKLYQKALNILPMIQVNASYGFDGNRVLGRPYDPTFMLEWESGYFCRSFLRGYLNLNFSEEDIYDEFKILAEIAAQTERNFFLYYDFQSKNIMIKDGKLRFIDFQGGRSGPLHYDLASLVLDPYVDIDRKMRQELIDYYLDQLGNIISLNKGQFIAEYPSVAIHRIMQMLGAFGFLSVIKKKRYFIDYIPAAVRNLKDMIQLEIFSPCRKLRTLVKGL
ncbi:MAG: phosphotransferase [Thermodesulfobacteriota bacterium]|nr:phosphotransferase [Thermodesulfobacteriota bacterium]